MTPCIDTDNNTSKEVRESFVRERNSLRRFLAGMATTTFSIFVTLHPQDLASDWVGWVYIACVVLNASSIIFFVCSVFGRTKELYESAVYENDKVLAEFQGREVRERKTKHSNRFTWYMRIGLSAYVLAVVAAIVYLIGEMLSH